MTTININENLFNFNRNKPGKKSEKPKQGRADKMRRTDDYWLKTHNAERRKQTKVRHDTHRREEQPDKRDLQLEDIHFANFLGIKDTVYGVPYNNTHINRKQTKVRHDTHRREEQPDERDLQLEDIHFANFLNICECDMLRPEPEADNVSLDSLARRADEMDQMSEDGDDYGSWANQISREPNAKWEIRWNYEPETQTLSGESYFKRALDEDAEEQPKKRAKEQNQEEAIFESMVAYMREQLELAQAMIDAGELFVCDCDHK